MSEHKEQCAIIQWAEYSSGKYPCLKYLHSSLNGVKLNIGQAVKAKREGMKRGVPDLFLPFNSGLFAGLYIELKVGYNKPSSAQKEWLEYLESQGFWCEVCYGADEAIKCIKNYLRLDAAHTQEIMSDEADKVAK